MHGLHMCELAGEQGNGVTHQQHVLDNLAGCRIVLQLHLLGSDLLHCCHAALQLCESCVCVCTLFKPARTSGQNTRQQT